MQRSTILPEGTTDFMLRRAKEGAGLLLVVGALALSAALLTFNSSDPSLNTASGLGPAHNLLGTVGAYISDLLLQTFGLSGAVPSLLLGVWGWRLFEKREFPHLWLRVLIGLWGMVVLSVGLSAIASPLWWPLSGGLGGVSGLLLLQKVSYAALALFDVQISGTLIYYGIAALTGLIGVLCIIFAFGLSAAEWRAVGQTIAQISSGIYHFGMIAGSKAGTFAKNTAATRIAPKVSMGDVLDPVDTQPQASVLERTLVAEPVVVSSSDQVDELPSKLVETRAPKPKQGKRAVKEKQQSLDLMLDSEYSLPPLDLLSMGDRIARKNQITNDMLEQNARLLESVLDDFGVRGQIVKVRPGPVVTLYELEPAPGTKTARVIGLANDIARSMSAVSVRIAVVPGQNVIGIELPNLTRETVHLREMLESESFEKAQSSLTLALGKDIGGSPVNVDLARMPHLLIAGTTGSGKSVAVNTMILSLLYSMSPDQCKFIMVDPKMLELSVYDGIPHLLAPVVTDPNKAVVALKWTVREMEDRYRAMAQLGVRNISGYNARLAEARKKNEALSRTVQTGFDEAGKPVYEEQPLCMDPLPFIVVIVDEMADLMLVAGKDIEATIQRLAQMARAAGIHLIMATQRPSVDVITGTIKANFPTRISFQVTSKIDSRTILGEQGAEQLLGQGDMLYMAGGGRISRVHGPFVADGEVESVVAALKAQGQPSYVEAVTVEDENAPPILGAPGSDGGNSGSKDDQLYDQAIAVVAREGKASTSFVQRHLQIGYNRAARLIERMEAEGVISKANRVGKREVLVSHHE
ncbi:MAG: DNA translocase FtsK 4TM domain-containing protein [Rhodospirillales bacterium]|nr:DNA translocase FtsK 4TM domain-containing protein [Rhodospirillales bacterium]